MTGSELLQNGVALGLDGGAGTLKFAVRTADGKSILYECKGANPTLIGMNDFVSRLGQAINDALGSAQCVAEQVTSAGFGLSGVDRAQEIEFLSKKLRIVLPNCSRIWIGNDALPALRQGAGVLRGLVLIAGTGSICYAVAADGTQARVGGWGGELGDEGSGYWIGLRGLQACCRMADGRLAKSDLLRKVLAKLGLSAPQEMIPWSASKSRSEFKNAVAGLYPIVSEQAAEGDQFAKQALLLGIGHLIQHVLAGYAHLQQAEKRDVIEAITQTRDAHATEIDVEQPSGPRERVSLVCAGGLFSGDKDFYDQFVIQLRRKRDIFNPSRLMEPASLGALALGQEVGAATSD